MRAAAGLQLADTPFFEKKRTDHGVVHSGLIGTTCYRVILVDDMLDTGGTLISACDKCGAPASTKYIFSSPMAFSLEKVGGSCGRST